MRSFLETYIDSNLLSRYLQTGGRGSIREREEVRIHKKKIDFHSSTV